MESLFEPKITLYSVMLLLGAAQGLFLMLVLVLIKHGHRQANYFLAALLLLFSLSLLNLFSATSNFFVFYPFFIGLEMLGIFLCGPLLYFYVYSLVFPKANIFNWRIAFHFLPFMLVLLVFHEFYFSASEDKLQLWLSLKVQQHYFVSPLAKLGGFFGWIPIVHVAFYLLMSLKRIAGYRNRICSGCSCSERVSCNWLRNLVAFFMFLLAMYVLVQLVPYSFYFSSITYYSLYAVVVISVYVFGFFAVRQPELFTRKGVNTFRIKPSGLDVIRKYEKTGLDQNSSSAIYQSLLSLMEDEKLYQRNELSLGDLAKSSGFSEHDISQAINEQSGRNFYDFLNGYRIREACLLLKSDDMSAYGILDLAMKSGFNSKSAFYSIFKKHTGITPLQYRKLQNEC